MNRKLEPYAENVCESGIACLVTMVQGNVLALGLSHWIVASQTGLLAGAIVGTIVVTTKARRPWVVSSALGCVTTLVDLLVHPGAFGAALGEAAVTGASAAALSLGGGAALRRWRARRSPVSAHAR